MSSSKGFLLLWRRGWRLRFFLEGRGFRVEDHWAEWWHLRMMFSYIFLTLFHTISLLFHFFELNLKSRIAVLARSVNGTVLLHSLRWCRSCFIVHFKKVDLPLMQFNPLFCVFLHDFLFFLFIYLLSLAIHKFVKKTKFLIKLHSMGPWYVWMLGCSQRPTFL